MVKKFLKYFLYFLLGLIGLVVLVLLCLPLFRSEWIEAVDGVELEMKRPVLLLEDVKEGSAMSYIVEATEFYKREIQTMDWLHEDEVLKTWFRYRELKKSDMGRYSELKEKVLKVFELVEAAVKAEDQQFVSPGSILKFKNMKFYNFMSGIGKKLSFVSRMLLEEGDVDGAMNIWKTTLLFGCISGYGGDLQSFQSGVGGCIRFNLFEIRRAASKGLLNQKQCAELLEFFESYEEKLEPLADVLRVETYGMALTVKEVYNPDPIENKAGYSQAESFLPLAFYLGSSEKRSIENLEACMTHLVASAEKPTHVDIDLNLMKKLIAGSTVYHILLKYSDSLGMIMAAMIVPATETSKTHYNEVLNHIRTTQVFLALSQYKQDKKTLPMHLGELVPQYLKKAPIDPFSGKELQYRSMNNDEYLVYSVYSNQTDEGAQLDKLKVNLLDPYSRKGDDFVYLSKRVHSRADQQKIDE